MKKSLLFLVLIFAYSCGHPGSVPASGCSKDKDVHCEFSDQNTRLQFQGVGLKGTSGQAKQDHFQVNSMNGVLIGCFAHTQQKFSFVGPGKVNIKVRFSGTFSGPIDYYKDVWDEVAAFQIRLRYIAPDGESKSHYGNVHLNQLGDFDVIGNDPEVRDYYFMSTDGELSREVFEDLAVDGEIKDVELSLCNQLPDMHMKVRYIEFNGRR